jgi:ATP-dependent exoDNAse (exonuclease V) beta subunit
VDFVEVAKRALLALEDETGATDLALKLDYRIQHLLIDEFQDTSPSQVELLAKLIAGWQPGDGRTLFCVGDPMQSIYRFRKADVGLFLQASDSGIGGLAMERLQLTRNNRSCPVLVDWVNDAFTKVFPQADDATRGAIAYRPFAATREATAQDGVMVHPLVLGNDSRSDDMGAEEARYLTELIVSERKLEPNATIAVLVRARAHLEALVAQIRSHHAALRFQAVEIEQLSGRQTVQDIHALTCALFHRADRVHWLAILRAPWCGLTLADMHVLAADDHRSNIWQLMQDEARVARLSTDGQQRLRHVRGIFAEAYAHQGRQTMRRWVEAVWLKLGGPLCLWDAGDVRDVQAFLKLLEGMDSFDALVLQERMEKFYAAPDVQADGKLQFMTIHKSKGLEFDTVILPGLHRTPRKKDNPLLLWEEVTLQGQPQLIAAPYVPKHKRDELPNTYDYLLGLEQERDANEVARLLYVAATRSKRRLHLVGIVKPDAKGDIKAPANTLLSLLWDSVGGEFLSAEPRTGIIAAADDANFTPDLIRLPHPAVPALLNDNQVAVVSAAADESAASVDITSLEASCGTLAHLYMEMFAQDGVDVWSAERLHSLQPAMQRWLMQQGFTTQESTAGTHKVMQALTATLHSEKARWVLGENSQAASELALMSVENGSVSRHAIDRTFVEDGVRWVIDYKSAKLGEGGSNGERYRPQLERYARLFRNEGLPIRKAVLFLSSGQLVELD